MDKDQTVNIVCDSFMPQRKPGALRAASISEILARSGRVNVIFLVQAGEKFEYDRVSSVIRNNPNIRLHPVEIDPFSKSNFIKRLFSESVHAFKLLRRSNAIDCDMQVVSFPILMLLPVSVMFNRLGKRRKNILEVRDLIWEYFEFKVGLFNRAVYHVLRFVCEYSISSFDEVVTVTKSQKESIAKFVNGKVTHIGNGIDLDSFESLCSIEARGDREKEGVVVTYAGAIGYPQNLKTLLDAVEILNIENFRVTVNILGDGPEFESLQGYCHEKGIKNVSFHGVVSFDVLKDVYGQSDVLYAQLRNIPSMRTAEPTKIFEYAAVGRAVIYGIKGDGRSLLGRFGGFQAIEPDNPAVLACAIKDSKEISSEDVVHNRELLRLEYIRENIVVRYNEVGRC